MKFVSVCSGIEAASVAWHPLGWSALGFAEIAPFPSRVLAHRWPGVHNYGDFTSIRELHGVDLLVGGTPCQSFSIAGLRGGLQDERGNLALEYCRLADRLKPRWLVWENVPGVLSSGGGRDFGAILGALAELGYGFAWRVLDAQNFGVPQRRRRVFLVGYFGDWRRAAAVLFERASMSGNSPPSRGKGAAVARDPVQSVALRGRDGGATAELGGPVSHTLRASTGGGDKAHVLEPVPFDTTQITHKENRSRPEPGDPSPTLSRSAHPPAICFSYKDHGADAGLIAPTLRAGGHNKSHPNGGCPPAIAFHPTQDPISGSVTPCLSRSVDGMGVAHCLTAHAAKGGDPTTDNYAIDGYRVRRLTPRECERLQGFPDDYTLIPGASDSARYKALGNSMAVPVMRWIGRQIARVDAVPRSSP